MPWHGPYRIREFLDMAIDDGRDWPCEDVGVYVVTLGRWEGEPGLQSRVLYVGGNTGKSDRFRTRVGDLIADLCGFFGQETGHHSGGQSLWKWCQENRVKPLDLHLGWQTEVGCKRCAEIRAYEALKPELNKKTPSRCPEHS